MKKIESEKMALSVSEAARELGISRPKVYDLIHSEGFPACKIGTRTIINRAALQRWLDERTGDGANE